jgi:hypothetical protein
VAEREIPQADLDQDIAMPSKSFIIPLHHAAWAASEWNRLVASHRVLTTERPGAWLVLSVMIQCE